MAVVQYDSFSDYVQIKRLTLLDSTSNEWVPIETSTFFFNEKVLPFIKDKPWKSISFREVGMKRLLCFENGTPLHRNFTRLADALMNNTNAVVIDLCGVCMGNSSMIELYKAFLTCPYLYSLDVSYNFLAADGVIALAEMM